MTTRLYDLHKQMEYDERSALAAFMISFLLSWGFTLGGISTWLTK